MADDRDRQTDSQVTQRQDICSNMPHMFVASAAMQPNDNNVSQISFFLCVCACL